MQSERGRDWDEITTEIVEDNAMLITKARDAANTLNDAYPDESAVTWREILNPRQSKGPEPVLKEKDEDENEDNANQNGEGDETGNDNE